jgi:serine/threonine-protein kinase
MLREHWQRLRPLLEQALALPEAERTAFVSNLGGEEQGLRDELTRLLASVPSIEDDDANDAVARVLEPNNLARLVHAADEGDSRLGQSLGQYRLVSVLGSGGMGTVYLAERDMGGFTQRVALKVVERFASRQSARVRFERERRILATLRHPGIASLFDGGETADGLPYYTMELMEGSRIDEYCCAHVPSLRGRVELLLQVAAALTHAHRHLVVHRDIKPGNILVTADGHVKLLDFGIAKLLGDDDDATATQTALGPMTREFAAPEQFRGGDITVATDVYQLGALAYRLLTGQLPYQADPRDPYAWSRAVSEQDPLPPERVLSGDASASVWSADRLPRVRRDLRGDLGAILRRALAKSPAERYGSIDAFAMDLRAYLDGRPVSARRVGAVHTVWRLLARRPYVSAGAAVALAALIATTLVAVYQAGVAHREAERARGEAARASSINDFLVGLFKVSDPGVNRGEKLTANQILERGAERVGAQFAEQPLLRARLQVSIADVYSAMGDYPRMRPLLESATETVRQAPQRDDAELGADLRRLAWLYSRQGERERALTMLSEAESLLDAARPWPGRELVSLQLTRGLTLMRLGDDAGAEHCFRAALGLSARIGPAAEDQIAAVHQDLGVVFLRMSRFRESMAETQLALDYYRKTQGEDYPETLNLRGNLAQIQSNLGELEPAHEALLDIARREQRVMGEQSWDFANALDNLCDVEIKRGAWQAALAACDKSLSAFTAAVGAHHAAVAVPMVKRARALMGQGHYAEAVDLFERAQALRGETLPAGHPDLAEVPTFEAEALARLGRYAQAEQAARQAIALAAPHADKSPLCLVEAQFALGKVLHLAGRDTEAAPLLDAARSGAEAVVSEQPLIANQIREQTLALRLPVPR